MHWYKVEIEYTDSRIVGYIHAPQNTVGELLEQCPDIFSDNIIYLYPVMNEKVNEEAYLFSPAVYIRVSKEK